MEEEDRMLSLSKHWKQRTVTRVVITTATSDDFMAVQIFTYLDHLTMHYFNAFQNFFFFLKKPKKKINYFFRFAGVSWMNYSVLVSLSSENLVICRLLC